ncbi:MAG: beta-ketoacyl synthase N-terminal-like domain-containing protein, partial [Bacteroidetes bacterium]|nr:beta-ketoacyl synthase N-terminal-like domain-containing protein [Bacteroidota bacterium]
KYRYPSAGGTYAVQTYLYAKEGAIEGLPAGLYYYHPIKQHLSLLSNTQFESSHQFYYNRTHFENAGFCLYFIGQLAVIAPIYGEDLAHHFMTLEAGYMGQLLMMHQADFQLGLRPIGGIGFDKIRHHFNLTQDHCLVHSFVGGAVKYPVELRAKHNFIAPKLAIVGVSGRYPGAANTSEFWEHLQKGESTLGPLPPERRETDLAKGGYLDHIDRFDHTLFHMSPFEARNTDPQERQLLEVVWECLENAGYTSERLNQCAKKVGVFIGAMWNDYQNYGVEAHRAGKSAPIGSFHSSIANRVSHFFNFTGPSLAIDTSCSSALSALHLACESIKREECGAAIVGGVNLISHPYHKTLLSNLDLLSQNENSDAFQAEGSGWLPGEGVGAFLILPLPSAEKSNDFIYALIKGTALSHSGRSVRFAAPNIESQVSSIQDALKHANMTPEQIDYIELAAAGASLADVSEIEALKQVFSDLAPRSLTIGTVKPNIGHLESASGMSQLTKVLLQMQHKKITPTLVSPELNPLLNLNHSPFRITSTLEEWTKPTPVLSLINAFGATGSCGNIILEQYETLPSHTKVEGNLSLIILSAATVEQLQDSAKRLQIFLTHAKEDAFACDFSVSEIAYTLQVGRVEMRERMAMIVKDIDELQKGLSAYLTGKEGIVPQLYIGTVDKVEKSTTQLGRQTALPIIAKQWAQEGAHMEWELLYETPPKKIPLPTYPFAPTSHWFDDLPTDQSKDHSLLGQTLSYLCHVFSQEAEVPIENLRGDQELENYGINSLMIKKLNARLENEIGELSKTLFYEYSTLESLAQFLIEHHSEPLSKRLQLTKENTATLHHNVLAGPKPVSKLPRSLGGKKENEDIAIIGVSGRYPQSPHLDAFWENLKTGKSSVTEVPLERWDNRFYQDLLKNKLGSSKNYSQWGAFLEDAYGFDPLFFNISPRDAESMDPQERLFLELSWNALEDAAYTPSLLKTHLDNRVGVFAGVMYSEYQLYGAQETAQGNPLALSSGYGSIANRVSYFLDLQGPSLAVDTLCSSSLTAIHLALNSLNQRECDMAIAGGVSLIEHPNRYILHAQMNMTSHDGRCRSFGDGG